MNIPSIRRVAIAECEAELDACLLRAERASDPEQWKRQMERVRILQRELHRLRSAEAVEVLV